MASFCKRCACNLLQATSGCHLCWLVVTKCGWEDGFIFGILKNCSHCRNCQWQLQAKAKVCGSAFYLTHTLLAGREVEWRLILMCCQWFDWFDVQEPILYVETTAWSHILCRLTLCTKTCYRHPSAAKASLACHRCESTCCLDLGFVSPSGFLTWWKSLHESPKDDSTQCSASIVLSGAHIKMLAK